MFFVFHRSLLSEIRKYPFLRCTCTWILSFLVSHQITASKMSIASNSSATKVIRRDSDSSNSLTELPKQFSIREVYRATSNFSAENKIGQGGFGTVYKGRLRDGSLIAIKRAKKVTARFLLLNLIWEQKPALEILTILVLPFELLWYRHLGTRIASTYPTDFEINHILLPSQMLFVWIYDKTLTYNT